MTLICHRFDTIRSFVFPRACHQPESSDAQDFSELHHRIYHVAPFGTGVRCVPSASVRCASHSAFRAKLKISFKQLSTGSIPVTSTIAKPRKPLFYAVSGAFTFNKSCIADIAKNRRYLLFLILRTLLYFGRFAGCVLRYPISLNLSEFQEWHLPNQPWS